MAFENINWGMPVQAKMNEAANFQSMIGQAIASYQANQERDIKRRQLEMEGVNVEKVAENALLKQNMGMPLTPKEQAAIQTMGQIGRPQTYVDPVTQQLVTSPSPWASLGIPQAQPQTGGAMRPTQAPGDEIYGGIPPVDLNMPIQSGGKTPLGAPLNQNMVMGMETLPPVAPLPQKTESVPSYQAPAELGARGKIMEEEFKKEAALSGVKADIEFRKQQMKSEAGKQKVTKTIVTTLEDLQEINDKLKAKKAIMDNDAGILNNLKNKYGATWVGRQTGSVTNTAIESLKQEYESKRNSLVPAYIAYNDLPATVVDTEGFQQRILEGFGDPSLTYQTNDAAIKNMRAQFGLENSGTEKNKPMVAPTREQIIQELRKRGKIQ